MIVIDVGEEEESPYTHMVQAAEEVFEWIKEYTIESEFKVVFNWLINDCKVQSVFDSLRWHKQT